ncbi:MAG: HlyD family efflux transporter periplasmic adaptor subunit [Moorellaceae bacterium]
MELSNLENLRRRSRPRKRSLLLGLLFWAFIGSLVYEGGAWLCRAVAWQALKTEKATGGVLEKIIPLEAVVIREESSLAAPVDGLLIRVVQEGERVAAGATIARLQAAGVAAGETGLRDISAPFAGQVCYHPDGLEKVLQPAFIEQLQPQEVFTLAYRSQAAEGEGTVKAGRPVVRLVNNLHPLYLLALLEDPPSAWQDKKQVVLRWPGQAENIPARVVRSYSLEGRWVIIFRLDRWGDQWLHVRVAHIEGLADKYRGVILPRSALVVREDGSQGVYFLEKKQIGFQAVQVAGEVGEKVAVQGLKEGTEVILNPYWVRFLPVKS